MGKRGVITIDDRDDRDGAARLDWRPELSRHRAPYKVTFADGKVSHWLAPDQLGETLAEERRNQDRFAPLPYHYLEVAFELLSVAEDDLQDANRIRVALVDIEDTRRAKVARGLKNIDRSVNTIKLPDISAMELNRIRGVAVGALDGLRHLEASAGAAAGGVGDGGGGSGGTQSSGDGGSGGEANARLQAALQKRQRLG